MLTEQQNFQLRNVICLLKHSGRMLQAHFFLNGAINQHGNMRGPKILMKSQVFEWLKRDCSNCSSKTKGMLPPYRFNGWQKTCHSEWRML